MPDTGSLLGLSQIMASSLFGTELIH